MREIRFKSCEELDSQPAVVLSDGLLMEQALFGWDVTDKTGEWELTFRLVERQGGRASWLVALATVGCEVTMRHGRTATTEAAYGAMEHSAFVLTSKAGWREPVNAGR